MKMKLLQGVKIEYQDDIDPEYIDRFILLKQDEINLVAMLAQEMEVCDFMRYRIERDDIGYAVSVAVQASEMWSDGTIHGSSQPAKEMLYMATAFSIHVFNNQATRYKLCRDESLQDVILEVRSLSNIALAGGCFLAWTASVSDDQAKALAVALEEINLYTDVFVEVIDSTLHLHLPEMPEKFTKPGYWRLAAEGDSACWAQSASKILGMKKTHVYFYGNGWSKRSSLGPLPLRAIEVPSIVRFMVKSTRNSLFIIAIAMTPIFLSFIYAFYTFGTGLTVLVWLALMVASWKLSRLLMIYKYRIKSMLYM